MARPEPNIEIHIGTRGRARVLVDGTPMTGVIGVELIRPADDELDPVWHIRVLSRYVNAKGYPDAGRG